MLKMDRISKALVLALQYIGCDRSDGTHTEDDDLALAEELAALIQNSTEQEKAALRRAANELRLQNWSSEVGI